MNGAAQPLIPQDSQYAPEPRAIRGAAISEYDALHQIILSYAAGHCIFDEKGYLLSWSETFAALYSPMQPMICEGLFYGDFLRALLSHDVVMNLPVPANVDDWIDTQVELVSQGVDNSFIHHLQNNKWVQIKHTTLENGHWVFAAFDTTELTRARRARVESENKFSEFARISSDWSWELDSNLNYLYHSGHRRPANGQNPAELVGVSRIASLHGNVDDNDQRSMHDNCMREHRAVDVVLSWTARPEAIHSHVIAEPQFDPFGNFTGYLGCGRDITPIYEIKQQLEYQANHDYLTDLLNRRAFNTCLSDALAAKRSKLALVVIDLDQFKLVNDHAGHLAGDAMLVEVSKTMQQVVGNTAALARLGGDEFAVLLDADEAQAISLAEKLIERIGALNFYWNNQRFSVGASGGVATLDAQMENESDILSLADSACYSAKEAGRNQVHSHSRQNNFQIQQNTELKRVGWLKSAMDDDRLSVFLQPIVAADDLDGLTRFEALLRVRDKNQELISPGEIIPVAEKYDLMPFIDIWVVENTIKYMQRFLSLGAELTISVNLSGNTLSNQASLARITRIVDHYKVLPGTLCFEITETAAIRELDTVGNFMVEMRKRGCLFALDDFGSGLSSYGYLESLQPDYLKIDGSFVRNIMTDSACIAIVKSFITLSHEMGMKTVAEFVENDAIANVLISLDIDYMQGFGLGVPRDICDWLDDYSNSQKLTGS